MDNNYDLFDLITNTTIFDNTKYIVGYPFFLDSSINNVELQKVCCIKKDSSDNIDIIVNNLPDEYNVNQKITETIKHSIVAIETFNKFLHEYVANNTVLKDYYKINVNTGGLYDDIDFEISLYLTSDNRYAVKLNFGNCVNVENTIDDYMTYICSVLRNIIKELP